MTKAECAGMLCKTCSDRGRCCPTCQCNTCACIEDCAIAPQTTEGLYPYPCADCGIGDRYMPVESATCGGYEKSQQGRR